MPTFDVSVRGKTYRIDIPDPGASPLQVIVDGQPFLVEIRGPEAPPPASPLAPPPAPAPEPPALPAHTAQSAAPTAAASEGAGREVRAPMPGTVLSVEVAPGDLVDAGKLLLILDAMKMKNPIRAASPGTVSEVHVTPGVSVSHGDLLITLT